MDGECSPRKKCDRRVEGEEEVDWISELPDEIIVSILSSLPLKKAAATSVLSSRWFDLWKYVPNLNFDSKNLNGDCGFFCIHSRIHNRTRKELHDAQFRKYIEFVDSVLESHKSHSLNKLRICLHMHASDHNAVTKWLEYVVSRKVKSLEFEFVCGTSSNQVVLEKLLRQSRLFKPQIDVTLFKSLERLCLKNLKVSGAAIELLLRNCPVLGGLAIHHAQFTSDVEVCGTTDLMLKYLDVHCCRGGNSIKVSAPNLAWLRTTTDAIEVSPPDLALLRTTRSNNFLLDNVPKLVGANLTYSGRIPDDVQHFAYALGFSQLKFLKLTLYFPKLLLANGIPQMPRLKKLVVAYSGLQTHYLLALTAFLWASPRLQEFRLKFEKVRPRDETVSMQAMLNVGRPRHRHLKLFELRWFNFKVDAGVHIKLVKYIVDNCVGLEEIIIGGSPITKTPYVPDFEKQVAQSEYALARAKERLRLEGIVPQHIQLHISQCEIIETCQIE